MTTDRKNTRCPECEREFSSTQALAGHRRFLHHVPGKKQTTTPPGNHLITDAELPTLFVDIFKSQDEVSDSIRALVDTHAEHIRELVELNHQHCDSNSREIEELTRKMAELLVIINKHIESDNKQSADLIASVTDLTEVTKDLVARSYGTEEART